MGPDQLHETVDGEGGIQDFLRGGGGGGGGGGGALLTFPGTKSEMYQWPNNHLLAEWV